MLDKVQLKDHKVKQVVNLIVKEYAEKKGVYPGDAPEDRLTDEDYCLLIRRLYSYAKELRHVALLEGYKRNPANLIADLDKGDAQDEV